MNNNNAINREVKPEAAPNGSATPPASGELRVRQTMVLLSDG